MSYRDDRRTNTGPGISRADPSSDGLTPKEILWTVEDLDRLHYLFREDARLVRGQSPYSIASYQVAYKNFRAYLVATAGLGAPVGLRLLAIEDWLAWSRDHFPKLSQTSIHSYWTKTRIFFNYLERHHGVPTPFAGLRPPMLPSRIPRARTPNECMRILESTRQYPWPNRFDRVRAVAVIALALFAGLRRSEVIKLKNLDVEMELGVIRVDRGKGRGGGKDRAIPISPDLRSILDDYLRERRRHGLVAPEFITCLHSRAGISLSTFRRIIFRVRKASGIPFSFHSLRHSFLTQLLRNGVPIHTVSALAGHTQITTTAGYLKVFDEDKEDALKRLRY